MAQERRAVRALMICLGLLLAPAAALADGEEAMAPAAAALEPGRALFTETATPSCSVCHTLAEAGAEGEVGPNLDALKPSLEQVRAAVTGGVGIMPAYEDELAAEEIEAIALYVSSVAGQAAE